MHLQYLIYPIYPIYPIFPTFPIYPIYFIIYPIYLYSLYMYHGSAWLPDSRFTHLRRWCAGGTFSSSRASPGGGWSKGGRRSQGGSFDWWWIPSGKHTNNYGKSPFLMGKLTISMAIFNSKLLVYQRVMITLTCPGQFMASAGFTDFRWWISFFGLKKWYGNQRCGHSFWPFEGSGSPRWNCNQLFWDFKRKQILNETKEWALIGHRLLLL